MARPREKFCLFASPVEEVNKYGADVLRPRTGEVLRSRGLRRWAVHRDEWRGESRNCALAQHYVALTFALNVARTNS